MSPYHVLVQAVKADPKLTFADAWFDFEAWERARGFGDDPSAQSKAVLDWVRDLYGLLVGLDEYQGPEVESCREALESAFVAFSRIQHNDEIVRAIKRWYEFRRSEQTEESTIASLSDDE